MRPGGNLMVVFSFLQEIDGLKSLMSECPEDKDMLDMATEELSQAIEEEKRLQSLLLKSLLPKDDADERDSILEVRAGNKYPVKIDI
jgi:peptide chain release factor 1